MAHYVDGFVTPVPKKNRAAYVRMSRLMSKVWREHGALAYCECVADDVSVGKVTSFPRSVKLKATEEVWFAWIVYKSRRHRNQINTKAMQDPRVAPFMNPKTLPFDAKRMFFGGFKPMVEFGQ